jgi:hypothetical protein
LKGAVELHTYRREGGEHHKHAAIEHLQRALQYWDDVIAITRPIYRDMPLTHYNHNFFVENSDNLFHWALVRSEVAADLDIARSAVVKSE